MNRTYPFVRIASASWFKLIPERRLNTKEFGYSEEHGHALLLLHHVHLRAPVPSGIRIKDLVLATNRS
jgi:hypothetical protein